MITKTLVFRLKIQRKIDYVAIRNLKIICVTVSAISGHPRFHLLGSKSPVGGRFHPKATSKCRNSLTGAFRLGLMKMLALKERRRSKEFRNIGFEHHARASG
jgi:hypothetical protein